jgi:S1-C subfamily serine protease
VSQAIPSRESARADVGFAIPASIVNQAIATLIDTGTIPPSHIGASGMTLDPEVPKAARLPEEQ